MTRIASDTFYNCAKLMSIEITSSLLIVRKGFHLNHGVINEKLGTLYNVLNKTKAVSPISQKIRGLIGSDANAKGDNLEVVYVNWRIYAKKKNYENGRSLLFTAIVNNIKWSEGLCNILQGNGTAIEDRDAVTGLEAFMLAAVGAKSNMESVFRLLQDHPAAINPYVARITIQQEKEQDEGKKRKRKLL